jgi:hypothetical protein
MKIIDHLFHISDDLARIKNILQNGFKPSYAREKFGEYTILVPMVSFSNILLRDVGKEEVLNYGSYGIAFIRQWGIDNDIHPVAYSYENGIVDQAIKDYFFLTIFLSNFAPYKDKMRVWSDGYKKKSDEWIPFSKRIHLTNTAKEVMALLDLLSTNYSEELADSLINYATAIRRATLPMIKLAKPYRVRNSHGKEFIAYNDREWRKIYHDLDFLIADTEEYHKWTNIHKPHYNDEEHRLRFAPTDIKAVLVEKDEQVSDMTYFLQALFGIEVVDSLLASGSLTIGTKEYLMAADF